MTSSNLDALIAKEEKNLERYKAKRNEYDAKVKKSEATLEEYKMMRDSQAMQELQSLMGQSGLSVAELFTALREGTLLDLQMRIEETKKDDVSTEEAE